MSTTWKIKSSSLSVPLDPLEGHSIKKTNTYIYIYIIAMNWAHAFFEETPKENYCWNALDLEDVIILGRLVEKPKSWLTFTNVLFMKWTCQAKISNQTLGWLWTFHCGMLVVDCHNCNRCNENILANAFLDVFALRKGTGQWGQIPITAPYKPWKHLHTLTW